MAGIEGGSTPVAKDTVSMIESILSSEAPATPPKAAPKAAEPEQPTQPEPEPTPEPEAEPEQNQQVEGKEDARPTAEIPLEDLEAIELEFRVKGDDGKDVTVKPTIKELREGYMMQKDYQRKTAELARQRDESGDKVRQAIEGERSQYQSNLQTLHDLVLQTAATELKDVNWNDLASNDPLEYVKRRNRADQFANTLTQVQGKMKEVEAKREADQKVTRSETAKKARAELERDLPHFNDDYYQKLMHAGQSVGYKPDEVATWIDPRAIKLLDKAYKYDQLQAEKSPTPKRVATPPKVIRSGTASENSQSQQKGNEALKRLRSNGSIENAADVIRSRLG